MITNNIRDVLKRLALARIYKDLEASQEVRHKESRADFLKKDLRELADLNAPILSHWFDNQFGSVVTHFSMVMFWLEVNKFSSIPHDDLLGFTISKLCDPKFSVELHEFGESIKIAHYFTVGDYDMAPTLEYQLKNNSLWDASDYLWNNGYDAYGVGGTYHDGTTDYNSSDVAKLHFSVKQTWDFTYDTSDC